MEDDPYPDSIMIKMKWWHLVLFMIIWDIVRSIGTALLVVYWDLIRAFF